ncbi:heat-inducible transcriptional repressor HrcA [Herbiconiux sp. VKM Ac-2851]|jgi:heat-inducible transcriptional repressor|uniref:heat-inducible transcriptional repressor HrcA n=1 Tax=Herbiconiux sp. VKM Ac-2851 TaxID=2739025 RepID=UPI00156496DF|nr:heat-inducible transcriptional repressor HrcA [Herbiconiux sp. VKM Ac-2851]NQX36679.1 heat-inducible transcriptional repressor HrcA [Herbiconiux sp. VKM Ac-2851]
MVSERSLEVLRVIVQDYVASREPVGSKSIAERHSFGVSAATIRNDMALLEEEELITAPHTSSGRVPTDKGYRLFVDHLSEVRPLTPAQRHAIEAFLDSGVDVDDVLARTVRLLSQLTHQVALVQYPSRSQARVRHIEVVALAPRKLMTVIITDAGHVEQRIVDVPSDIDDSLIGELRQRFNEAVGGKGLIEAAGALDGVPERFPAELAATASVVAATLKEQVSANRQEKLLIAGAANLVRTEDDFHGSILPVLEAVEEQVVLLRLFSELEADQRGLLVSIGRENESFGLGETSILASGYTGIGSAISRLGVLGPTRMDYSSNISAVRAVARYLSRTLGETGSAS